MTGNSLASAAACRGARERSLDLFDANEQPRERIHEAVDGLVGDRLALVGAAAEHLRVAARSGGRPGSAGRGWTCPCPRRRPRARSPSGRRPRLRVRSRSARTCSSRPTSRLRLAVRARHRARAAGRWLPTAPRRRKISAPSGRSEGSCLRRATQSSSRSGGMPRAHVLGGGGSSLTLRVRTSMLEPTKGRRPASAS